MAAFPQDFLWGAATAAYQVEGALLFGISTRTSREPPFRAPMAISPSITITAFVKMSP